LSQIGDWGRLSHGLNEFPCPTELIPSESRKGKPVVIRPERKLSRKKLDAMVAVKTAIVITIGVVRDLAVAGFVKLKALFLWGGSFCS
jgi:hypothetical protein